MAAELAIDQIVRPPTLATAVAANLRDAILRGKLAPGAALREEELCGSLGVSRGTVREALRTLRAETLVELYPHRGAFVTQISYQKAYEVYTLRALLEPYAVRVALEQHAYSPLDLQDLSALVHQLGGYQLSGDILAEVNADHEFHIRICAASNHHLLLTLLEGLQSLMVVFMLSTKIYQADPFNNENAHQEILDALRSGIPARGEAVLREHIEQSGLALLRRIEEVSVESNKP